VDLYYVTTIKPCHAVYTRNSLILSCFVGPFSVGMGNFSIMVIILLAIIDIVCFSVTGDNRSWQLSSNNRDNHRSIFKIACNCQKSIQMSPVRIYSPTISLTIITRVDTYSRTFYYFCDVQQYIVHVIQKQLMQCLNS